MTLTFDPNAPARLDYMIPAKQEVSVSANWAKTLLDNELDSSVFRPYLDRGKPCICRNEYNPASGLWEPKVYVTNDSTNATLTYDDWRIIDREVTDAAKPRLKLVRSLIQAGLVYRYPGGMAKTQLVQQTVSRISGATISMDPVRDAEHDRPVFATTTFPLPVIHKDWSLPFREILASRQNNMPLDAELGRQCAERVGEQAEQLALGSTSSLFLGQASFTWGGATIYGLMNHPGRLTVSITLPTAVGWQPLDTVDDVLEMQRVSRAAFRFGPWRLFFGPAWSKYMDGDYKPTYNDTTLRQRLLGIEEVDAVELLDYIPDYSLILVQMNTGTIRLVIGMDITTLQWEVKGGLELFMKTMCIMLPQIRGDFYSSIGIIHGNG